MYRPSLPSFLFFFGWGGIFFRRVCPAGRLVGGGSDKQGLPASPGPMMRLRQSQKCPNCSKSENIGNLGIDNSW